MDRGSVNPSVRTLYDRLTVAEYLEFISLGTFKYIYIYVEFNVKFVDV